MEDDFHCFKSWLQAIALYRLEDMMVHGSGSSMFVVVACDSGSPMFVVVACDSGSPMLWRLHVIVDHPCCSGCM